MVHIPNCGGGLVLRLIVGLALLGWPRAGIASGTWSVISVPQKPGEVISPTAAAVDAAGDLYVVESANSVGQIQRRDVQGNWTILATEGSARGQVNQPASLAVDGADNLYVADQVVDTNNQGSGRIQKRDTQGNWSVIASSGWQPGQVAAPVALAVDTAGNLYVAEGLYSGSDSRIQRRDAQGNWSILATAGGAAGQVLFYSLYFLAVDGAGNLYLAETGDILGGFANARIQRRDAQGNWSVLATRDSDPFPIGIPSGLAADAAGNLYVADYFYPEQGDGYSRIVKRDAQGNWSILGAGVGGLPGQFHGPSGLAVDTAGNLYVADTGNNRVQVYTPGPGP